MRHSPVTEGPGTSGGHVVDLTGWTGKTTVRRQSELESDTCAVLPAFDGTTALAMLIFVGEFLVEGITKPPYLAMVGTCAAP